MEASARSRSRSRGARSGRSAYELALLTAAHLEARGTRKRRVDGGNPRGGAAAAVRAAGERGHARAPRRARGLVRAGAYAGEVADGELRLIPEGSISAERVVALPRLSGAPIDGLPQTVHGFVSVDAHCRVHGIEDVFAAGDITSFTVKQGGIATQQADAAAEAIAAAAGADVTPQRFRPVLRGLLLTGGEPRYLRREMTGDPEQEPMAGPEPLWWPPAKIVGRYLAPFLASIAEIEAPPRSRPTRPDSAGRDRARSGGRAD